MREAELKPIEPEMVDEKKDNQSNNTNGEPTNITLNFKSFPL